MKNIIIIMMFIWRITPAHSESQTVNIGNWPVMHVGADTTMSTDINYNTIATTKQVKLWGIHYVSTVGHTGAYSDLTGKPSLASVATSGLYSDLSGTPIAVSSFTNDAGYITASSTNTLTNKSGNISMWTNNSGYITAITSTNVITALGYTPLNYSFSGTASQYTKGNGTYATFPTNVSSFANDAGYITTSYVPTINAVTRPINSTTFTPSTTKQATLIYNIQISCTATIGGAAAGSLLLQYSTNGGSSWIDAGTVKNSNTVTLAITLNSVTIQTASISAVVPANALCKMVPTTSGTTTITYISGQEVY